MKKYLLLTAMQKDLTEEAQKKIDDFEDNEEEPKDSYGRTAEHYEDLGIPIPKELIDKGKTSSKLELNDEDYEYSASDALIDLNQFKFCVDIDEDPEEGAIIYLKENMSMSVLESSAEIYSQIRYLNRGIFARIEEWIRIQIYKFKRKNGTNSTK